MGIYKTMTSEQNGGFLRNLLKLYKTDEMVNGCVIMLQNKCNTLNVQIEDLLTPVSETTPWLTFTTSNL